MQKNPKCGACLQTEEVTYVAKEPTAQYCRRMCLSLMPTPFLYPILSLIQSQRVYSFQTDTRYHGDQSRSSRSKAICGRYYSERFRTETAVKHRLVLKKKKKKERKNSDVLVH